MADKGLAPLRRAFPTLSFGRLGDFCPHPFRVSQSHLCERGPRWFCVVDPRERGGVGWRGVAWRGGGQLLHKARDTRWAPAPVAWCRPLLFFAWVWKGTMNSNVKCAYFDSSFFSSGELDKASNNIFFFFFLFYSEHPNASLPSASLGNRAPGCFAVISL